MDIFGVLTHYLGGLIKQVAVADGVPRVVPQIGAHQITGKKELTVAVGTTAHGKSQNIDALGNLGGHFVWDHFHLHSKNAGFLQCHCIVVDLQSFITSLPDGTRATKPGITNRQISHVPDARIFLPAKGRKFFDHQTGCVNAIHAQTAALPRQPQGFRFAGVGFNQRQPRTDKCVGSTRPHFFHHVFKVLDSVSPGNDHIDAGIFAGLGSPGIKSGRQRELALSFGVEQIAYGGLRHESLLDIGCRHRSRLMHKPSHTVAKCTPGHKQEGPSPTTRKADRKK